LKADFEKEKRIDLDTKWKDLELIVKDKREW
jgi:hypothetical protein